MAEGRRLDLRSALLLGTGMACFGSALPVSGVVGEALPVWLAAELRLLVAAVALLPAVLADSDSPGPLRAFNRAGASDRWLLAGMGLIGTFAFSALMVLGMRAAPGAVAATVMGATPAVTAVGALLFLREKLGGLRVAAVALAVAGVVVVNLGSEAAEGSGHNLVLGSLLVFAAVCCEAAYSLMGKQLTASLSPLSMTLTATVVAAAASVPLALYDLGRVDWSQVGAAEWLAVGWWGAGSMALGSVLWFRGMARVDGSVAAPFMGFMPLSALLISYPLLGESPRWIHAAGMVLILSGIALVTRADARAS